MNNKYQHYFFFALLAGALGLTVYIFLPFLTALIIAIVFSVIFRPMHLKIAQWLRRSEQSSLAALITLIIVAIVVITPLGILAGRISAEGQSVYAYLTDEGQRAHIIDILNNATLTISQKFLGYYPVTSFDDFDVTHYAQSILKWSFTNIDSIFSSVATLALNLFILLFAMYYMLRDGGVLRRQIIAFSPLLDTYDEEIFTRLDRAIHSVVSGSLVVGLIQGILTGIGFSIFGVPNPALWGSLAVIAALIPGFGTSLVLIPAIVYLFLNGAMTPAIGLLVWAVVAVGMVDNFLAPMLMRRGIHIHQFIIFLSVMGGISFLGPIGFILGPLIVALLFALLDIYKFQIAPKM